jgi:hypothetical protein
MCKRRKYLCLSDDKNESKQTKQLAVGQNLILNTFQRCRFTADRTGAQWHGPVAQHPDTEIIMQFTKSTKSIQSHNLRNVRLRETRNAISTVKI